MVIFNKWAEVDKDRGRLIDEFGRRTMMICPGNVTNIEITISISQIALSFYTGRKMSDFENQVI